MTLKKKYWLAAGWLILGVVLIGVLNAVDPVPDPYLTTVIYSVRTVMYFIILVLWIYSLRMRLLISKTRDYLTVMGGFVILFFLIQAIKYRVLDYHPTFMRYAWYSYYIPLVLICIFFLMACISFLQTKFNEKLLLIPAVLLVLIVLTNDLHHWVFIPVAGETFDGGKGSYTRNFVFYLIYAFYFLCVIAGLMILVFAFRSRKELRRKTLYPFLFLVPWVVTTSLLFYVVMPKHHEPYKEPDIFIFGVIGVIEICIACGLIPHNENYIGFFKGSRIPAVITDKELQPVYATEKPLHENAQIMAEALEKPVYDPSTGLRTDAKPVRGGYVFWGTDESGIRQLNEELEEANRTLSAGNELLKKENELRATEISVKERERLDRLTSQKMRPYLDQIEQLLENADSDRQSFDKTIERVSSLNCVVKRGANMLLCADENNMVEAKELLYAVKELATVYEAADTIHAQVIHFQDFTLSADDLIALLDSVRLLLDYCTDNDIKEVGIIIEDGSCVLLISGDIPVELPKAALPIGVEKDDDLYRIIVSAKGGDEAC
ncbi:MAG: hypothetical protein IJG87_09110 [Ruminococcus sp.]|nr:hypothetical protein [Ruminococcus sp.]